MSLCIQSTNAVLTGLTFPGPLEDGEIDNRLNHDLVLFARSFLRALDTGDGNAVDEVYEMPWTVGAQARGSGTKMHHTTSIVVFGSQHITR